MQYNKMNPIFNRIVKYHQLQGIILKKLYIQDVASLPFFFFFYKF